MPSLFDPWQAACITLEVLATPRRRPALMQLQRCRLTQLLSAARASPLYGKIIGSRSPSDVRLQDLPVFCKAELMQRFDEWVADPRLKLDAVRRFVADPRLIGDAYLGRYLVWESSGSSGEPGVFVNDAQAIAVYDALEALRRPPLHALQGWWNPWQTAERVAFVGAINGHFASYVSVERLRRVNPWLARALRAFSFLQSTARLNAELEAFQPTAIATYPTAAVLLAEEVEAGRLSISPREVWTGGEALTPAMRRFVSSRLRCPVSNSYGASEFLALASECSHQRLHLNSDWVILECVDDDGQPVPAGESGARTLLTNLANQVQPVIRYDLGDRVTLWTEPCQCGSALPVIEVEGRVDDALVLLDEHGQKVRLLPLALTTVLEDDADVFDFQLLQRGDQNLLLHVPGQGPYVDEALQRGRGVLQRYLCEQGLPQVTVDASSGLPCTRGRSGKVQRVVALNERN